MWQLFEMNEYVETIHEERILSKSVSDSLAFVRGLYVFYFKKVYYLKLMNETTPTKLNIISTFGPGWIKIVSHRDRLTNYYLKKKKYYLNCSTLQSIY